MKNKGLYIHIPFCDDLCPYCSFCHVYSFYGKQDEYIEKLVEEINQIKDDKLYSIYIGGGTPSILSDENTIKLLSSLQRFLKNDISFTIEINPDSFTQKKAELYAFYGINRVSIGVQTFNKKLQKIISRSSNFKQIENLIFELKKVGILDINIDLMYGIPSQTIDDLKEDLDLFKSLDVSHISCYSLQIEEHTTFYNQGIKELDEDTLASFYEEICKSLKQSGFIHYEVSNFAKKNKESKHNLLYWKNQEYIGLGVSSSGYEGNIRYTNATSINNYINCNAKRKEELVSFEDEKEYYIILALRLKEGIVLSDYEKTFNSSFLEDYKEQVADLLNKKICLLTNTNFCVKEEYMFTLNQVLIKFLR